MLFWPFLWVEDGCNSYFRCYGCKVAPQYISNVIFVTIHKGEGCAQSFRMPGTRDVILCCKWMQKHIVYDIPIKLHKTHG